MEVSNPGVEAQEFLSAFPPLESLLLSFLSSCRAMFLLNDVVTACCGDHLLVIDVSQTWDLPDRGSVTAKLISVNDLWDIVFPQQPGQEGLCGLGIPMSL